MPPFVWPRDPQGLAKLDALARCYGTTPHAYLGIAPTTEALRYWCWAVDDAASYCADYLAWQAELRAKAKRDGYEIVGMSAD